MFSALTADWANVRFAYLCKTPLFCVLYVCIASAYMSLLLLL